MYRASLKNITTKRVGNNQNPPQTYSLQFFCSQFKCNIHLLFKVRCISGVISQFLEFSEANTPSGGSDWAVLSWSFCSTFCMSPSFSVCTFGWLLLSVACSSGTPGIKIRIMNITCQQKVRQVQIVTDRRWFISPPWGIVSMKNSSPLSLFSAFLFLSQSLLLPSDRMFSSAFFSSCGC